MGPFAHADGGDLPRPFDELVPGLAAERDDVRHTDSDFSRFGNPQKESAFAQAGITH